MRCYFLIISLFLFSLNCLAQPSQVFSDPKTLTPRYPVRNFSMQDGLPTNTIRALHKDSRGYLWIGTDAGVCCYNGRELTLISVLQGLPGNRVWSITEDDKGFMWFGLYGNGVCRYDGKKFTHYTQASGLADDDVRKVFFSKRFGILMIGTEHGISILRDDKFLDLSKTTFPNDSLSTVTGFLETSNQIIITSYYKGVLVYDPERNDLYPSMSFTIDQIPSSSALFLRSSGDTVVGMTRTGIVLRPLGTSELTPYDNMGQVFDITEDSDGRLWLAAWAFHMLKPGGIFCLSDGELTNYSPLFGIKDEQVWCVYYDSLQHLLWVGTLQEGLFRVNLNGVRHYPPEVFGLSKMNIRGLLSDKNHNLWIGTTSDLIRISPDGQYSILNQNWVRQKARKDLFKTVVMPTEEETKLRQVAITNGLTQFRPMAAHSSGTVFVDLTQATLRIPADVSKADFISNPRGSELIFTTGDTLIAGAWSSVYVFPRPIEEPKYFLPHDSLRGEWPKANVRRLYAWGDEIWFASTKDAVYRYKSGMCKHFNPSKLHKSIQDICQDPRGYVVIGDYLGQISICRLIADSLVVERIIYPGAYKTGNIIHWMLGHPSLWCWVGSNFGLSAINLGGYPDKVDFSYIFLDAAEGYIARSASRAVMDEKGRIWTGGQEGLVMVETNTILKTQRNTLPLIISKIAVNGEVIASICQDTHVSFLPHMDQLIVAHDQNDLDFHVELLNFLNPEKDKFRYRLLGMDTNWSSWSNERHIKLNRIPPGRYSLEIEAQNTSGLYGNCAIRLPIIIRLPLYQKWYVILLFIITFLSLSYLIIHYWMQRVKQRERREANIAVKLVEYELNALQAQMNPHFIFNIITTIQGYMLDDQIDKASSALSRFAELVRNSFNHVNRKMISLREALDFVENYITLENLRFNNKIELDICIEPGLDPLATFIQPMIIQPFVENAVRHGLVHKPQGGKIDIEVQHMGEGLLYILIRDNGIGRRRAAEIRLKTMRDKEQRVHSIEITTNRIKLMNTPANPERFYVNITDLFNNAGVSCGTLITISIPYYT